MALFDLLTGANMMADRIVLATPLQPAGLPLPVWICLSAIPA